MCVQPPSCLNKKPKDFWQQVVYIAQKRYQHCFPDNMEDFKGFKFNFNKLAVLRDLCLSVGLQIECADYDLRDNGSTNDKDVEEKSALDANTSSITTQSGSSNTGAKKENGLSSKNNLNL